MVEKRVATAAGVVKIEAACWSSSFGTTSPRSVTFQVTALLALGSVGSLDRMQFAAFDPRVPAGRPSEDFELARS